MRIIQWVTLFIGVGVVSATWPNLEGYTDLPESPKDLDLDRLANLPGGQVYGAAEIKALAAFKDFVGGVTRLYPKDKAPYWAEDAKGKLLPHLSIRYRAKGGVLAGPDLRGYQPVTNSDVMAHLTAKGYVADQTSVTTPGGVATWKNPQQTYATGITGTYWGIPVQATNGANGAIGYLSGVGSVMPGVGYPRAIEDFGRILTKAVNTKSPNGWKDLNGYLNDPMKANLESFHRGIDTSARGRYDGLVAFGHLTASAAGGTEFDAGAIIGDTGHVTAAKAFLKMGSIVSTISTYPGQATYSASCSTITKRYLFGRPLAKRAGNCMPDDIQIVGDDTEGISSMTPDDQLRAEVNSLRGIKALTGNPKILPNDVGEGFTVDPADWTELDPSSIVEGSLTGDEAWESVEGSFNDVLEKAPGTVDRPLASKVMKMLKKNLQARIQALKEVPNGAPADKIITAEARKMAMERMVAKYFTAYGTHYQRDDPDDPVPAGVDDGDLNFSTEMPFHDIDYRNLGDLKDIAEGNLIDDAATLDGTTGGLEGSPKEEDGGLDYFRPELAVAGTTEYSKLWGFLGDKIDAVLKDPKAPKWKLLRARAMLSRTQKSIEARTKELQNKQKEGVEITQVDVDEYEAMHEFHGKISDSLDGKDIDSMPDTAEDKANPLPEFSVDPGAISSLPPKITFKPQKGKPGGLRKGIKGILNANRRWKYATRPLSVGGNKKN